MRDSLLATGDGAGRVIQVSLWAHVASEHCAYLGPPSGGSAIFSSCLFAKVLPLKEAEQRFGGIREPFLDILLIRELARRWQKNSSVLILALSQNS